MGSMQEPAVDERLSRAREAVALGAWTEAYELFTDLDAEDRLKPGDVADLARASHWTGRMNECLEAYERAYRLYLADGKPRKAGMAAIDLVRWHRHKLQPAVAAGWLRRAERLLAEERDTVEYGYLQYRRAADALAKGDLDTAVALTTEAEELGRRFGDLDLELLAQHERGIALIAQGEAEKGFSLIDEAAAAAIGGELGPVPTAIIYCNTITACRDVADYGRAGEWTEAAKRWCDRQTINGFPGMCRVYRAEVMRLRGDWAAAREDAQLACDELRDWSPNTAGAAFYELGEIRFRTGDLDGAEAAFRQAHELGRSPAPGLALLHAARGDARGGAALIDRAVAEETHDRFARARLLPAQVELAIATGALDVAAGAAAELRQVAEQYESPALRAAAATAEGAVALAGGDTGGAISSLRAGLRDFGLVDLPYETASARLLLGRAYLAAGDERAASLELESARAVFERLGAALGLQRVVELQAGGSGEAATKAFVFTDIVDSTPLAGALGDEAWTGLLAWHDRTLREVFAAHGGEVVHHTGDGFFVAFDDAGPALASAVAIQRRLAEHRRAHGFAPGVRIGVHEALARRAEGSYRGHGVHEAARIGALGGAGEIVASLASVAGRDVRHAEPRTVELKGVAGPVEVVTVDWS
jgi:class 3 adenylate cyclase